MLRVLETAKPFYSLTPLPMVHDSPRSDSEAVASKIDSPQLGLLKKMKVSRKRCPLLGRTPAARLLSWPPSPRLLPTPSPPTSQSKGSICFSSASVCKGLAPAHLGKMQLDTAFSGPRFCLSHDSQAELLLLVSGPSL